MATLSLTEQEVLLVFARAEKPLTRGLVEERLKERQLVLADEYEVYGAIDVLRWQGLLAVAGRRGNQSGSGVTYEITAGGRRRVEALGL
mgnify:CR=1 FL=1